MKNMMAEFKNSIERLEDKVKQIPQREKKKTKKWKTGDKI